MVTELSQSPDGHCKPGFCEGSGLKGGLGDVVWMSRYHVWDDQLVHEHNRTADPISRKPRAIMPPRYKCISLRSR